jgi:hypothetical protein
LKGAEEEGDVELELYGYFSADPRLREKKNENDGALYNRLK